MVAYLAQDVDTRQRVARTLQDLTNLGTAQVGTVQLGGVGGRGQESGLYSLIARVCVYVCVCGGGL